MQYSELKNKTKQKGEGYLWIHVYNTEIIDGV